MVAPPAGEVQMTGSMIRRTGPGGVRSAYHSTMNIARLHLRRWATGLTIAALPLIGVAVAPTGLAQDGTGPCAWNVASLACMQYQTGGVEGGPCAWDVASLACMQSQTAGAPAISGLPVAPAAPPIP